VILDVMLPGKDGFEVCRAVRARVRRGDPDADRARRGLRPDPRPRTGRRRLHRQAGAATPAAGAHQGAAAPRAGSSCRRRQSGRTRELTFGSFRISQRRAAPGRRRRIDLTTAEFDLLWLLARHAGSILSRDDLLQELRGIGFDGLDRSIDARISRLRRKLGDDPENPTRIKTVRGKGYLFSKHDWQ
jgi:two-component system OmpR family response regulator